MIYIYDAIIDLIRAQTLPPIMQFAFPATYSSQLLPK